MTARDATSVTLQTRQGEVRVALEAVIVHRVVRPAPWRIETFLRHAGVAVLDLDSAELNNFDDVDRTGLEALISDLAPHVDWRLAAAS